MIRYLKHKEINKGQWDDAVLRAGNSMAYAFSWYLDCMSPGWEALVEDDYQSVFPLPVKRKAGIIYLAQPPFTQQLGLFSETKVTEKKISLFFQNIPEKIKYIDIQLNEMNPVPEEQVGLIKRRNILLDLSAIGSDTEKKYHENTRRNLQKFLKTNLQVVEDPEAVEEIIRLFTGNQGKQYPNIKQADYEKLKWLLTLMSRKRMTELFTVRQDSHLLSGALFLKSPGRYIFLFSANAQQGRENHALVGIVDHFIRRHAGEKKLLDFEGSDHVGLARFYLGFGGYETGYYRVVINRLPWLVKWLKK